MNPVPGKVAGPVRCAIYTRKSSEEGLEQAFNSLDAQREACAAYILSQASEGWTALPDIYDDGGLSGGTLERPALQRLLAEVKAGHIDIIVVYKVDRLTRSLLDFSKLVEAFDAAGTSFVSVTQSFNTTTSMGRLTLNMLLSFAQFEREVTAERIRDKIAASKARGMWMGGTPPLGYAPDGRSLSIVEPHAELIRDIFQRYLRLGNVRRVAEALARDRIVSPQRTRARSGGTFGGLPLSRGQIYGILKCPTYIGEVHHKEQMYPGLHQPIIDRDVWDRTQAMLAANLQGHRSGARVASPSLLAGKVVDDGGQPLIATHATAGKVRYRYYVSRQLQHGNAATGMRIPARELELAVTQRLAAMLDDGLVLASAPWLSVPASAFGAFVDRAAALGAQVAARDRPTLHALVDQVRIHDDRIEITCCTSAIAQALNAGCVADAPAMITLTCDVRLRRSGRAMRLIQDNGAPVAGAVNGSLVKLLVKARRWWAQLRDGEVNIQQLASREQVMPAYLTRVLRLAFLSPAVVDAILAGRQSSAATVTALTLGAGVDPSWATQGQQLLTTTNRT